MSIRGVVVLALLSVAVGCAADGAHVGVIDYQLDSFFPAKRQLLHIEADGRATRSTPENGTQTRVLAPAALDQLTQKIEAAKFSELDPSYLCSDACPFVAAPQHTISVQIDDHAYHVVAESLNVPVPPRLFAVIDALELTLEEGEWR